MECFRLQDLLILTYYRHHFHLILGLYLILSFDLMQRRHQQM
jgi:hypothetical protein